MTDHTDTALGGALQKHGVLRHNVQFNLAIAKFQNAGGTYEDALNMLNRAYGRRPVEETEPMPVTPIAPRPVPTITFNRSMPGRAPRGADAIAAASAAAVASLFDTFKLRDGRTLGEIRWCDVPALRTRFRDLSAMEDRLLAACYDFGIPADQTATLKVLVPESVVTEVYKAKGSFDAD